MLEVTPFGRLSQGREAHAYTLASAHARVRVCDFGAALLGVEVPDSAGNMGDVLLGYASAEGYAGPNPACYGGVIGPVANRTDRAEVPVAGAVYHLPGNDGPDNQNNLHSDLARGLHKRLWEAGEHDGALLLSCTFADGELGLPGNRTFSAVYELSEPSDGVVELSLSLGCTTDAETYVNMTSHAYFNLAGHAAGSVLDELVCVDADAYLPLRPDSVSAGTLEDISGTPFDLRVPGRLGAAIDAPNEQLEIAHGYDHCFCIRGYDGSAEPRHALRLEDEASGRMLDISITAPGAHLYTGNWLDDSEGVKDGARYTPRCGVAFEPEFYPDAPHHPEWPQPVCAPGKPYFAKIVYRFSTR